MINVMRLARGLGRVVDVVLETVDEAEVLGYMEMEYTVRRMVEDMVKKMDPSQYGNMKNTSIIHYLISLIDRIMSSLDRNSKGDVFENCVTLFGKSAYILLT